MTKRKSQFELPDDIRVLLISLNVLAVGLAEALAKVQPATARVLLEHLRTVRQTQGAEIGVRAIAQLERYARMVEDVLEKRPQ